MDHLISCSGEWSLWKTAAFRSTGMPIDWLERLASETTFALARELVQAQSALASWVSARLAGPSELDENPGDARLARKAASLLGRGLPVTTRPGDTSTFARGLAERSREVLRIQGELDDELRRDAARVDSYLRELHRSPRFLAAMTWQSRSARDVFDRLTRRPAHDAGSGMPPHRERRDNELVVKYLQRYCAKNDTIGFFGPIGWATFGGDSGVSIVGAPLGLARREVYFEGWAIDACAKSLSARSELRSWMTPRLVPFLRIEAETLLVPGEAPVPLTPDQAAILRACDGTRTTDEVASYVPQVPRDEVISQLEMANQLGALTWGFDLATQPRPSAALRDMLERIEDAALREQSLGLLAELEAARLDVERAADDPDALRDALDRLDVCFTRLTGEPAKRLAGGMYAGRTLAYEDCLREAQVLVGADVVARLAGPMALVLSSSRWFTYRVAEEYRKAIDPIFERLAGGGEVVPLADLHQAIMDTPELVRPHPLTDPVQKVYGELLAKWGEILGPLEGNVINLETERVAAAVASSFACPGPGWSFSRSISPDVMIAARDLEAVQRGDHQLVLGEVHYHNSLANALRLAQDTDGRLRRGVEADAEECDVFPVWPKDLEGMEGQRMARVVSSGTLRYHFSVDPSPAPPEHTLRVADLEVHRGAGTFEVRHKDREVRFDLFEVLGPLLTTLMPGGTEIVPDAPHVPRIVVDGVVLVREHWRFPPTDLSFAQERTPALRFAGAVRWAAEHGIPRWFFLTAATERKPVYVDLASPILIEWVCGIVRRAASEPESTVRVAEMLPSPTECWFRGPDGERYTNEFRIVCRDSRRASA